MISCIRYKFQRWINKGMIPSTVNGLFTRLTFIPPLPLLFVSFSSSSSLVFTSRDLRMRDGGGGRGLIRMGRGGGGGDWVETHLITNSIAVFFSVSFLLFSCCFALFLLFAFIELSCYLPSCLFACLFFVFCVHLVCSSSFLFLFYFGLHLPSDIPCSCSVLVLFVPCIFPPYSVHIFHHVLLLFSSIFLVSFLCICLLSLYLFPFFVYNLLHLVQRKKMWRKEIQEGKEEKEQRK